MQLNHDHSRRVTIFTPTLEWVASPVAGVERRLLERDGEEVARATSLVRYRAGARFPRHEHGLGEEFLVLHGTFTDEHGIYPAGTYVRNPVGSAHAPFSEQGCELFVKLRHLDPRDRTRRVVSPHDGPWRAGPVAGMQTLTLAEFAGECTSLVRCAGGTSFESGGPGGQEILVLEGEYVDEQGRHAAGTWLRIPPGPTQTSVCAAGCLLWVKTGHLSIQTDSA